MRHVGIVAALIVLAACSDGTGPGSAQIMGTLTDSLSGAPVAGALLTAGNSVGTSGADGRYRLDITGGAPDQLTVTASGFEAATAAIPPGHDATRNLILRRLAPYIPNRIAGSFTVIDLQGAHSLDWTNWTIYLGVGTPYVSGNILSNATVTYLPDTTRALVAMPSGLSGTGAPRIVLHDGQGHYAAFDCPVATGNCTELTTADGLPY